MDSSEKKTYLFEMPWLAMLAVMAASVFSIYITRYVIYGYLGYPEDNPWVRLIQQTSFHLLAGFIIAPYLLRLPKGKSSLWDFMDDIGLTHLQPFIRLVLLGVSCSLILALSQAAASIIYRGFEGYPINLRFLKQAFDFSAFQSFRLLDWLTPLPSIFEEVAFRGIVLTVFLGRYSVRESIIFSSIGFGLMHLINLSPGRDVIWVLSQVIWSSILGLFYGYCFVKAKSLWPPMIVHYLGNLTIFILSGYMISRAPVLTQAINFILFSFGILPTLLMIVWTRFFSERWLEVNSEPIEAWD